MDFSGNNENILFSPLYEFSNREESFSEKDFEFHERKNDSIDESSQNFINNFQQTFNEEKNNFIFKNDELDDNFEANTFLIPELPKKAPVDNNLTNLGKTRATSLLGIKTNRSEEKSSKELENEKTKKNNCGRKSKNSKVKGEHNKYSEDNIMRKIKSYFLSYVHKKLNNSFIDKKYQFLKLYSFISECLKKDYNVLLMKRTFKDLYQNSPISGKFRKQKENNPYCNKTIIEHIDNQNNNELKEFEVISILNRTYLDVFKEFIIYGLDEFLNEIKETEDKNGESEEDTKSYIKNIKKISMDYENWFLSKNGRFRK
jgi:hypothetical protein